MKLRMGSRNFAVLVLARAGVHEDPATRVSDVMRLCGQEQSAVCPWRGATHFHVATHRQARCERLPDQYTLGADRQGLRAATQLKLHDDRAALGQTQRQAPR